MEGYILEQKSKKYTDRIQYIGTLYMRGGFFTEEEYVKEIERTHKYYKQVMFNYKSLPWYKKLFMPRPFTTFSDPDNKIYNI